MQCYIPTRAPSQRLGLICGVSGEGLRGIRGSVVDGERSTESVDKLPPDLGRGE